MTQSHSPFRILLTIAASIFVAEMLIMIVFRFLPSFSPLAEAFVDSAALILLISPVLYWFGFRPLVEENAERGRISNELSQLNRVMEQTISDRTYALTALAASAEISRRLSTATNPRQLAVDVVEQVQSAFHYYHAHIYFLDETSGDLVMAGGTGEAGAAMLARGHRITQGRGLVGRAAESKAPVLVPDVSQAADWLPNPLLPDTKSEAAIPISSGNQVLGVLDVQHNVVNGLGEEAVKLLQSLAAQVAISLQNARSFEQSKSQADLESLVNAIGQKIQRTTTVEDTLQTAIRELGLALGATRVSAKIASQESIK